MARKSEKAEPQRTYVPPRWNSRLYVLIDPDVRDQIHKLAASEGITPTAWVRRLVMREVAS